MIDLEILSVTVILVAAVIVPGPDFLVVSRTTLVSGRTAGCCVALGIGIGCLCYSTISVTALTFLFTQVHSAAVGTKIIGGLYLLWIAWQIWPRRTGPPTAEENQEFARCTKAKENMIGLIRRGLFTNLANPKAVVFFSSVFAAATAPTDHAAKRIGLVLIAFIIPTVWFCLVSSVLSFGGVRAWYRNRQDLIDRVAAIVIAGFGLKLITPV